MFLKKKMQSELLLKTASLLNNANLAFKGNLQVVKVRIVPPTTKDAKKASHNITNLFGNRSVEHYASVRMLNQDTSITYFFLIENCEEALNDLKKTLKFGVRKTFGKAEIIPIEGSDTLVVSDLSSLLQIQNLIMNDLDSRLIISGNRSYVLSGEKLPPIAMKVTRATA